MKTTLFAATLVVALTLSAAAATKKPAASQHLAGGAAQGVQFAGTGVPPVLCDPCIFYGGDLNVSNINAAGLSDENTVFIPGSSTYGSITLTGISATITGIVFNVQADANFDPLTASYDVETGVVDGIGGTSIASGTANTTVAATGRNFIGLNEYSVAVNLNTPLKIGPGQYWFNLTPACTNGGQDGSCSAGRMFVSNTTNRTNAVNGTAQVQGQMFLNSSFFGFTWANWCDSSLGLNSNQCAGMSFGLMGTLP